MTPATRRRLCFALAAALVFITAGYFRNTRPGWNVNAQFDLTVALVERGTLRIDEFQKPGPLETMDKVFYDGHFYSDKSPVTSFLGVPAYALYKAGLRATGRLLDWEAARYWTTWLTMGPCAALLAWALAALLARRGVDPARASLLAALWIASTPLLGYSILFFNYVPACMFAALGLLAAEEPLFGGALAGAGRDQAGLAERSDAARLGVGGLMVGLACWALQTFAALALILTVVAVIRRKPREWPGLWPWAVGGLAGVAGYAVYSWAIFGAVTSPYRYEFLQDFREPMERGLMGATFPKPLVAWLVTFHPFRGLFPLFPATLAATLGAVWTAARGGGIIRASAISALAFLGALILYTSGYFMWWGGWTYAPRHLIPALAVLGLGMAPFASEGQGMRGARRAFFWGVVALMCAAAIPNLMVIALDPQPPPGLDEKALLAPETVSHWPAGLFPEMMGHVWRGQTDPNWGNALGLKGFWSLTPLIAAWGAAILGWAVLGRLADAPDAPEATASVPDR